MNILTNHNLLHFNTFGLVATSRYFVELNQLSELEWLRQFIYQHQLKYTILGEGSNVLLPEYYDGIVIHNRLKGISHIFEDGKNIKIEVMSGENWDSFVSYAVKSQYYGIENLSLIPGSVGAGPVQNIGAYGVELSSIVDKIQLYDMISGKYVELANSQCDFRYRYSIFKTKPHYIITSVCFILSKIKHFNYNYADLKSRLGDTNNLTLEKMRNTIIGVRSAKLPNWREIGNVGSFFHNPIIAKKDLDVLLSKYPNVVYYQDLHSDLVKISAGWLIDNAGLKGYRHGNVGVYKNQALVLVNYSPHTTQKDILNLAHYIQIVIKNTYNIDLTIEPLIIN